MLVTLKRYDSYLRSCYIVFPFIQIIAEQFVDLLQSAISTDFFSDPVDHEFFMTLLNESSEITNSATDSLVTLAKQYYTISNEHLINRMVGFRQSLL